MGKRLNPDALDSLVELAEEHIALAGLPGAALAVAWNGTVLLHERWGSAEERPLLAFSATKAVTASAVWLLLQRRQIGLQDCIRDYAPSLPGGFDAVTIHHLLTHTAGCPEARLDPADWTGARAEAFADWRLSWEPGSRFQYHPASATWLLAHVIEQVSGHSHTRFIREEILEPLELHDTRLSAGGVDIAPIRHVGSAPTDADEALPVRLPAFARDEAWFESFNDPAVREVGVPGTGLVTTAADLARFYQALLTGQAPDGRTIWEPATLDDARTVHTGQRRDPMTGRRANRGLGVILAGGSGRIMRGFGAGCAPTAFGHPGMGGQVAWADPTTGLSFVFLTSGLDRNVARLGLRMATLSSAAARVVNRPASASGLVGRWAQVTRQAVDRAHFELDSDFVDSMLPWMERFGRYFDAEVRGMEQVPREGPVLLVGNHSGGMLTPDTAAVMAAWYRARGTDEPLVGLGFDAAFGIPGFATLLRRFGLVPASRANAARALQAGRSVLVYPGGAHEVFRPWSDRNQIDFGGHDGFVKLALREQVPVVPVVGHGGHETTLVLTRGEQLGKWLGLDRIRMKSLPILLQFPWGVSPAGIPSVPLPAKITVEVGDALRWEHLGPEAADDPNQVTACYREVVATMQSMLDRLVADEPQPLVNRLRRLVGA